MGCKVDRLSGEGWLPALHSSTLSQAGAWGVVTSVLHIAHSATAL
jgi:hypothetical protein